MLPNRTCVCSALRIGKSTSINCVNFCLSNTLCKISLHCFPRLKIELDLVLVKDTEISFQVEAGKLPFTRKNKQLRKNRNKHEEHVQKKGIKNNNSNNKL